MDHADKKEMLLSNLIDEGYLRSKDVIESFRKTPRELFVLPEDSEFAYLDHPLQIGLGQTISAPHMVAIMTEELKPGRKDKILEIGGGSGYQAAILSPLARSIVSIELEEGLSDFARENLRKAGITNVELIHGDGSSSIPEGPYDRILVSCGSDKIYPEWVENLKDGGFILVPLNRFGFQTLYKITKNGEKLEKKRILDCSFVPLRH